MRSRPVFVRKDERIKAHFLTCFLSLLVYRILEKKMDESFTCSEIIQTLRKMNMMEYIGEGYIPTYTRTELTDKLHDVFGFRTDTEIVEQKKMKKIIKQTKNKNVTHFFAFKKPQESLSLKDSCCFILSNSRYYMHKNQ